MQDLSADEARRWVKHEISKLNGNAYDEILGRLERERNLMANCGDNRVKYPVTAKARASLIGYLEVRVSHLRKRLH